MGSGSWTLQTYRLALLRPIPNTIDLILEFVASHCALRKALGLQKEHFLRLISSFLNSPNQENLKWS